MALYHLYLPKQKGAPYPLILILPILGRLAFLPDFFIEKMIAGFFAKQGMAAAVLDRGYFYFDVNQGIGQIDNYLSETVAMAQRAIKELCRHPKIDGTRIGTLGISFGGIINVLLTAQTPAIKASVIALAGGNLPEILITGKDPLLSSYRSAVLKGLHMTNEEFLRQAKNQLKQEPLKFAEAIDANKVLMINAKHDRVVMPKYSLELWKALGNPALISLPWGHYFSMIALPFLERKAFDFFQNKLSLSLAP